MEARDIDALAKLYLRAYGVSWSEDGAARYLRKFYEFEPASCLVVQEGGPIVAAVLGYTFEKESGLVLYIQELFVDPASRNRGHGKKLVAALRESCIKAPSRVNIKPLVKADTSVLNFYNSLGFERDKAVTFWVEE
jgi:ribosomal protein S18 acetylase RimI-like enzyme